MLDAKLVADLITVTRALFGPVIVWLGITRGQDALPIVAGLMLLDWTGDFVDGGIARRSSHPRRTLVGDSDLYVDLFVSICLGIYLIAAGLVGPGLGFGYLLAWLLVIWRFGLDRNLLMLLQTPIYLWFIVTALRLAPDLGKWLVVWVLVATAINWRRFSREIVPKFIGGMRSLWQGRRTP